MIDYQFRRARSSAKETDENESERKQKTWRKQEKDGRRRREFGDSRMRTMHFILEGYSRGGGGGRSCGKEGKTPRHGILISPLFPQYPGRNEERSAAFYPPPQSPNTFSRQWSLNETKRNETKRSGTPLGQYPRYDAEN